MNIDQRLHRAAHDLREIAIDVPPLAVGSTTKSVVSLRRFGAPVAAVMLFAVGAIVTASGFEPTDTSAARVSNSVAVADPVDSSEPGQRAGLAGHQLSAREELAMISSLALDRTEIDLSIPRRVS